MPINYFPPLVSNLDWGKLTGELSTQSDLAAALAQKANINHSHEVFTIQEIGSPQIIDSTDYTVISDLQFEILADKEYELELMLYVNKSVTSGANDLRLRCDIEPDLVYFAGLIGNNGAVTNILSNEIFTTSAFTEISNINDTLLGRFLYFKTRLKASANGTFSLKAALSSASDEIEIGKGSYVNYKL